jgi:hypothetical protein
MSIKSVSVFFATKEQEFKRIQKPEELISDIYYVFGQTNCMYIHEIKSFIFLLYSYFLISLYIEGDCG